MRRSIRLFLSFVVLGFAAVAMSPFWWPAVEDLGIARAATDRTDYSHLDPGGPMRVLICGAGTPQGGEEYGQACVTVSAGGLVLLFDAGSGVVENLKASRVPLHYINHIFLTHWHSDHFNGLGAFINYTWIWGRKTKATLYGPPGVRDFVAGIDLIYARDREHRREHMPLLDMNQASISPIAISAPPAGTARRIFEQNGVTVDAVSMRHEPVRDALGYLVGYNGKSVFISGDTATSQDYAFALKKADLVVHEAMSTELIRKGAAKLEEFGRDRAAYIARGVTDYHADTIQLAKLAEQHGVQKLVLTHLIPAPEHILTRWLFTRGMADHYSGELILARDGLELVVR